ncbi:hypothetical protein BBK82_31345 [Lentzea guizhouensis]|uniref:Uncharacterized protein n=1 Tax=Lentzea guizhouensis TaxID=1586287 RepID=A0A1B2HQ92_9PSEU|nr:hypothetical protein [Lentzea guizhouensis]ANZ39875.1 hypothetical protein BBK82_31345 [Lentzea guizhouensis]
MNGVAGLGSYYRIRPEVAGGLGDDAVLDHTGERPVVTHLHYEVADWLGDCIVSTSPEYLVVPGTAARLQGAGFRSFRLAEAQVTASDQFEIFNPGGSPPELLWLRVDGTPGVDDLGITEAGHLVVSEAVLELLRADGFDHGLVLPWSAEQV